jgi:aryl carrier-like protein
MLDLLGRGRQVAVIDVAERLAAPSDDLLLAGLDRIQRQTEHDRLRQLGATVVAWADDETPQGVVARAAVRQRQRLRA